MSDEPQAEWMPSSKPPQEGDWYSSYSWERGRLVRRYTVFTGGAWEQFKTMAQYRKRAKSLEVPR